MDFFRFLVTKRFLRHFLGVVLVLSVVVWFMFWMISIYTRNGKHLQVPDFSGMTIEQVTSNPDYKDFTFIIVDSLFEPEKPKGSILRQDPYPASEVKKGRKIYLTIVSFYPEKTSMPDLKYLTLRQAINTLETIGLKKGRITYIRTFDADAVQEQFFQGKIISSGTILEKGSTIDLTVGMGSAGQEYEEPEVKTEPDSL